MKSIIPLILISLIIAACTTRPPETDNRYPVEIIDDKYLVEKTNEESKNIFAMESAIIEKNRERLALEKKINTQVKLQAETEKELERLKEENKALKDQIRSYGKSKKNAANLKSKKTALGKNENQIKEITALLQYRQLENDYHEAELNLINAELAVYIAELRLEESKIATIYRDKRRKEQEENKEENKDEKKEEKKASLPRISAQTDPDNKYGYKRFSKYLNKAEKDRTKAEAIYKETEKKYLDAKEAIGELN